MRQLQRLAHALLLPVPDHEMCILDGSPDLVSNRSHEFGIPLTELVLAHQIGAAIEKAYRKVP